MTNPMIFDGNEQREMTVAEFAQYELDQATNATQADAFAARTAAREALLDRLGITADEAQLLLGGM